jgi:hypothetical protein
VFLSHHEITSPLITCESHYYISASHLEETKDAIFQAGAGQYEGGRYVQVAFQLTGQGQFLPVAEAGADPHTGAVGQLEKVDESRVEILCQSREIAKAAVAALKKSIVPIFSACHPANSLSRAHPYEVPAYEVYKLENF